MNRKRWLMAAVLAACSYLLAPTAALADPIILGQTDTFQTGPEGWHRGGGPVGVPPTPLPTVNGGGPAGAGDNFLLVTSTGGAGPLSRPSAINTSQWSGNYVAAGVNAITMDLNNFGQTDLHLRLLFVAFGPMGPTDAALTSLAVIVPAGSGWTTATFLIGPGDLTASIGTASGALTSADELRLFHNPNPFFSPGMNPAVVATLGVDNIRAVAAVPVPEPATLLMLATGLAGAAVRARRPKGGGR